MNSTAFSRSSRPEKAAVRTLSATTERQRMGSHFRSHSEAFVCLDLRKSLKINRIGLAGLPLAMPSCASRLERWLAKLAPAFEPQFLSLTDFRHRPRWQDLARLARSDFEPASAATPAPLPVITKNRDSAATPVRAVIHAGNGLTWSQVRIEIQGNQTLLRSLVPLPGRPFQKSAGAFVTIFQIRIHPKLLGVSHG